MELLVQFCVRFSDTLPKGMLILRNCTLKCVSHCIMAVFYMYIFHINTLLCRTKISFMKHKTKVIFSSICLLSHLHFYERSIVGDGTLPRYQWCCNFYSPQYRKDVYNLRGSNIDAVYVYIFILQTRRWEGFDISKVGCVRSRNKTLRVRD